MLACQKIEVLIVSATFDEREKAGIAYNAAMPHGVWLTLGEHIARYRNCTVQWIEIPYRIPVARQATSLQFQFQDDPCNFSLQTVLARPSPHILIKFHVILS